MSETRRPGSLGSAPRPFAPIAVLSTACLLPGCPTPEALWQNVLARRDLVGEGLTSLASDAGGLPAGWEAAARAAANGSARAAQRAPTSSEQHAPTSSEQRAPTSSEQRAPTSSEQRAPSLPVGSARDIPLDDPVFRWALATGWDALQRADMLPGSPRAAGQRAGLVLGNMLLPTRAGVAWAGQVWGQPGRPPASPYSRFSAGLPALWLAETLGLSLGGFALDAACASSLYALKLACDRLQAGEADWMLVGAVSHADATILDAALGSVGVLSPTHQSRPFHQDADGMVWSEGAAFVVLKRLDAAIAAQDPIRAVIRGIGLGNSGRARALLAPSERGQVEAMRLAYAMSGLVPEDISLVECHATGNMLSDLIEVRSLRRFFTGTPLLPIGSLRANLGHPIAASGLASLIKVIYALETGLRPATLHTESPLREVGRAGCRLLGETEPWEVSGIRRAALSSFGFGGNNAHMLVEAWEPALFSPTPSCVPSPWGEGPRQRGTGRPQVGGNPAGRGPYEPFSDGRVAEGLLPLSRHDRLDGGLSPPLPPGEGTLETTGTLAVIGLGVRVGDGTCTADFVDDVRLGRPRAAAAHSIALGSDLAATALAELAEALPQQLWMLDAAREALAGIAREELLIGTVVGLQCDPNGARSAFPHIPASARSAASFTGRLTNMVTNRLNHHFDLRGPSVTLASEEASGLDALAIASQLLRTGEADMMLVGAVDLASEPVHAAAARQLGLPGLPGDAAIALLLARLEDAQAAGHPILALLPSRCPDTPVTPPAPPFGHPHAAAGLLAVAVAIARDSKPGTWQAIEQLDMLGKSHSACLVAPATPYVFPRLPPDGPTVPAHEPPVI